MKKKVIVNIHIILIILHSQENLSAQHKHREEKIPCKFKKFNGRDVLCLEKSAVWLTTGNYITIYNGNTLAGSCKVVEPGFSLWEIENIENLGHRCRKSFQFWENFYAEEFMIRGRKILKKLSCIERRDIHKIVKYHKTKHQKLKNYFIQSHLIPSKKWRF